MDYKYDPEWKVLLILHFFIELLQPFNCTNKKTNLSSSTCISEVKTLILVKKVLSLSCFIKREAGVTRSEHRTNTTLTMPPNTYHSTAAFPPPQSFPSPIS